MLIQSLLGSLKWGVVPWVLCLFEGVISYLCSVVEVNLLLLDPFCWAHPLGDLGSGDVKEASVSACFREKEYVFRNPEFVGVMSYCHLQMHFPHFLFPFSVCHSACCLGSVIWHISPQPSLFLGAVRHCSYVFPSLPPWIPSPFRLLFIFSPLLPGFCHHCFVLRQCPHILGAWNLGWPWAPVGPPASVSPVLGLQAWIITPGSQLLSFPIFLLQFINFFHNLFPG